jgi:hypothetical protein
MRILFLCGCLEPGMDGVGDYTISLALELSRQGHEISCVACNDHQISSIESYTSSYAPLSDDEVRVHRFSSHIGWQTRFQHLHRIFISFNPDWVSLQYVPYSFASNGLPLEFTYRLQSLRGPWLWHVMFHELWIAGGKRLKSRFISLMQRSIIQHGFTCLSPLVHTSIAHYREALGRIGLDAAIHPLHSNIQADPRESLPIHDSFEWNFVFFGSLDPQWQSEPFFSLVEISRRMNQINQCHFISLGRVGKQGTKVWQSISSFKMRKRYPNFTFQAVGELNASEISSRLLRATFGISMAPLQWLGKSGSVAAMVAHGLPVIVPIYPVDILSPDLNSFSFGEQLILIDGDLPAKLPQARRLPVKNSSEDSARSLVQSFDRAMKSNS